MNNMVIGGNIEDEKSNIQSLANRPYVLLLSSGYYISKKKRKRTRHKADD
jgi:hypothetical protein